ncbi:unnamed protein product, partial [marine sediment metagenome]
MAIPFINNYIAKTFISPAFAVLGLGFALEGLRRAWLGGTALTLFIDIGQSTPESCLRDVAALRVYLDIDREVINSVEEFLWPLIAPWIDHHNAQECFYEIAIQLCNQRNAPYI